MSQQPAQMSYYAKENDTAPMPQFSPPKRTGQFMDPNMSFNLGSMGGSFNQAPSQYQQSGMDMRQNNPYGTLNGGPPQIYSAVYSGVDVYEMEVNGVAVMRRRADSWLNATQILKVAGIEKGKRTKVLEKEILIGEHEKVQGGYGKYQGTWIKFEKGLEFCRQYGVEDLLRPLLTYDMGQDGGVAGAGQGGVDTPTKEQAMAAQRKRLYTAGAGDARLNGQSGTFFKNISSTASHAVAAISKARFDSPGPRRNGSARPTTFSRQSSSQLMEDSGFPTASQQSNASFATEATFNMNGDSAYSTQNAPVFSQQQMPNDFAEPPRKRMRTEMSMSQPGQLIDNAYDMPSQQSLSQSMREPSPTEANDSFSYQQPSQSQQQQQQQQYYEPEQTMDGTPMPLPPLQYNTDKEGESKRALIMSLFMDPSRTTFDTHDVFRQLSGSDFDIPVDTKSHTALHWAATLARLPLVRALIAHGASIYRVNSAGETALMRAVSVTNNLDYNSFPLLLEVLGPTIPMRDALDRTVLHHIAVTSAVKGRSQCSKYYLESLLEFVVRQGSAPNSQNSQGGDRGVMSIGRFMSEIVNAQDKRGDTALLFAARVNNRSIIHQLVEVGADPSIPNKAGLRPVEYGIGLPDDNVDGQLEGRERAQSLGVRENSGEIISSISTLIQQTEQEFGQEMEEKQKVIDGIHASLRATSGQLGQAQVRLKQLQSARKERDERVQKIRNLRNAADEEGYRLQQLKDAAEGNDSQETEVNGREEDMYLGQPDVPLFPLPLPAASASLQAVPSAILRNDPTLAQGLPSVATIRARIQAYRAINEELERGVGELRTRSRDVEGKYRRVISLCTKTPEERVDDVLGSLVRAVESEGNGVEVGRLQEFLGKVEGTD